MNLELLNTAETGAWVTLARQAIIDVRLGDECPPSLGCLPSAMAAYLYL